MLPMEPQGTQGPSEEQGRQADVPAAEHIKAARIHLRNDRRREAYAVLLKASSAYPNHPLILSSLGWLQADIDKRYKSGLAACRKAIALFRTADRQAAERVYPFLYLNLGRAYLAAGMKKDAVESFRKGLLYGPGNAELKREMRLLGVRKTPPIEFLSRANVLNRIIGKLVRSRNSHADH